MKFSPPTNKLRYVTITNQPPDTRVITDSFSKIPKLANGGYGVVVGFGDWFWGLVLNALGSTGFPAAAAS